MNLDAIDSARRMLHVFQMLNQSLGSRIAASRTWDMLLFLKAEVCPQSARSIAQSLGYPLVTTARWLLVLHEEGIVSADTDAQGKQRFYLTTRAHRALEQALAAMCQQPMAA